MTRRTKRTIFGLAVLVIALWCLAVLREEDLQRWSRSFDKWRTDRAIRQCCTDLPAVDEVRLLHLEAKGATPSLGSYTTPLEPRQDMVVVADKTLSGMEAQQLTKLWKKQLLHNQWGTCHDPHHLMQFRKDNKVIAEVVVCFSCENVAIRRFPGWKLMMLADFPEYEFRPWRALVESHVGAHIREKPPIRKSPE
jgi:hypothetical protein